jgi:hypothetical protein
MKLNEIADKTIQYDWQKEKTPEIFKRQGGDVLSKSRMRKNAKKVKHGYVPMWLKKQAD